MHSELSVMKDQLGKKFRSVKDLKKQVKEEREKRADLKKKRRERRKNVKKAIERIGLEEFSALAKLW